MQTHIWQQELAKIITGPNVLSINIAVIKYDFGAKKILSKKLYQIHWIMHPVHAFPNT